MRSAWAVWFAFRKQALRSCLQRWRWLGQGVHVGEGARIPGGGRLDFAASSSIQRFAVLNARKGAVISLGRGSRIGAFAVISAIERIDIGADVLIADRVFISDHDHASSDPHKAVIHQGVTEPAPVSIGDGCWLGINVCILPGVQLGPHCIVAAGAVVTRSFAAGSIVGGVPARFIRSRFEHVG